MDIRIGTFSDYKHYLGSIKYDTEDKIYYGSLINVNDLVSYHSESLDGLLIQFRSAVDDYEKFKRELFAKLN